MFSYNVAHVGGHVVLLPLVCSLAPLMRFWVRCSFVGCPTDMFCLVCVADVSKYMLALPMCFLPVPVAVCVSVCVFGSVLRYCVCCVILGVGALIKFWLDVVMFLFILGIF